MTVRTEYQAVITCDYCWDNDVYALTTQIEAIKASRKSGWQIGKKVKCPKCREKLNQGGKE